MESGHHRLSTQKDFISIADAGKYKYNRCSPLYELYEFVF